jgi:hypothetical protein
MDGEPELQLVTWKELDPLAMFLWCHYDKEFFG